jgi:CheY-like chemotaxis protein
VRPHAEPGDAPPERRARILILDDEAAITRALSRLLRARHDVEVANDARRALAMLEGGASFDLLLCDLEMPGMNGVDFVEALARSRPELRDRVVFMSGGGCTPRTRAFLETTSIPQLSKPFPREVLDELLAARGLG